MKIKNEINSDAAAAGAAVSAAAFVFTSLRATLS